MRFVSSPVAAFAFALAFSFVVPALAAPPVDRLKLGAIADPVSSLIIRFEPAKTSEISALAFREVRVLRANAAASRFGVALSYARSLASGAELLKLDRPMPLPDAQALATALARTTGVRYAVPNRIIRTQKVPSDPLFSDVG
ncbi:MAG: hypothetical protein ABIZ64_16745, partial [Casimicrobium sp.]